MRLKYTGEIFFLQQLFIFLPFLEQRRAVILEKTLETVSTAGQASKWVGLQIKLFVARNLSGLVT